VRDYSDESLLVGVALVGFGGPRTLREVAPMFQRIFGEAPVPTHVLESGRKKYELIGGASPLPGIAEEIAEKLRTRLRADVSPGMQYSKPLIDDAVEALAKAGCEVLVYLSMTPFHSRSAFTAPFQQLREAARKRGCKAYTAQPIGLTDEYVMATAISLCQVLRDAPEAEVLFVAHSLPLDGSEDTALYERELRNAAEQVMRRFANNDQRPWTLAYTSRGARGAAWLGPDAAEVVAQARERGAQSIVVSPLGFATDHMEVLYDLDIKLKAQVEEAGLEYRRAETLGASDGALEAYVRVVEEALRP